MIGNFHPVFCVKRTQHTPLNALHAKNRVRNAYHGPERYTVARNGRFSTIYNGYVHMTRATSLSSLVSGLDTYHASDRIDPMRAVRRAQRDHSDAPQILSRVATACAKVVLKPIAVSAVAAC